MLEGRWVHGLAQRVQPAAKEGGNHGREGRLQAREGKEGASLEKDAPPCPCGELRPVCLQGLEGAKLPVALLLKNLTNYYHSLAKNPCSSVHLIRPRTQGATSPGKGRGRHTGLALADGR